MNRGKIFFSIFGLALLAGCAEGVPVTGLNDQGQEQYFMITPSKYSAEMSELASEVMLGISKSMANRSSSAWGVHTVAVGVGAVGEIQAGPLKYTVEPRIRFIFTDKVKPTLP